MYNLTHRLQVVESSTIKKITVTDNAGLPERQGVQPAECRISATEQLNKFVCKAIVSASERIKKHICLSDRFSWQTE